MRKLVHPILTGVGILSVVLGIIGIFLPLMPTTPFLLLAAFCFARSSPRCHQWLHQHRWFGPYLTRYQQRHAMTRRDKLNVGSYPLGPVAYFQYIDDWRKSGKFAGLTFRKAHAPAAQAAG